MSQSTTKSRKETERTKLIQEKCQTLLTQMLRDEDNKYCVDCDAKGPRWASWNIGVFLCIRCAGIHRNLGVHISRVKSVNLDTWTPEQVISLQQMGNSRARAVYEAQLPDGFRRPQIDSALESFIRAKYEQKKYLALEWVPPTLPKVDWAKEIDEELEKQKRKKKAAQSGNSTSSSSSTFGGINSFATNASVDNSVPVKSHSLAKGSDINATIPQPPSSSRSKSNAANTKFISAGDGDRSSDLLGLSSPKKANAVQCKTNLDTAADEFNLATFGSFLSSSGNSSNALGEANNKVPIPSVDVATASNTQNTESLLVKEEEDFFSQGSLETTNTDRDGTKKLTKDGILALYGNTTTQTTNLIGASPNNFAHHHPHHHHQTMPVMYGGTVGYMMPGGGSMQQQQHQFMTPPNSTSMYNAPVMTAPTAFTNSGIGSMTSPFNAQFVSQNLNGMAYTQQQQLMSSGSTGDGNKPSGQSTLMNLNHSINRMGITTNVTGSCQMPISGMTTTTMPDIMGLVSSTGGGGNAVRPTNVYPNVNMSSTTSSTGVLNQQFENLNIGNAWQ